MGEIKEQLKIQEVSIQYMVVEELWVMQMIIYVMHIPSLLEEKEI